MRRRRCTTVVGTRATAPSNVNKSTGTSSTSECVDASETDSPPSQTGAVLSVVMRMADCIGSVTACVARHVR